MEQLRFLMVKFNLILLHHMQQASGYEKKYVSKFET